MANPLAAIRDYLTGADLRRADEEKALTISGFQSYTQVQHLLVHGPGASEADWEQQRDTNSAVFACLMALCASYIEPTVKVWRRTEPGQQEHIEDHPLQELLDDPHPNLTGDEVWFWTQWARHLDGNAYLRKVRAGNETTGNVVMLVPISPLLLTPITDGPREFISRYRYNYAPGKWEDIPPENIIHFRLGVDDQDTRLGMSPLKRLVREVATDAEATKFSKSLLENFAIPGLVVTTPQDAARMPRDEAEALSDRIASRFGGEGRGRVGVLAGGASIAQIGFSPEQMRLDILHGFPESRIAAALGVPPAIAGLQIGLEQTANYASMRQLRENFTEIKLVPLWRLDDATINKHLLPDFDSGGDVFVMRDMTDVRALQEDENEKYKRLTEAVAAGWVLPDEARADVGLPPMEDVMPAAPPLPEQPETEDEALIPEAAMRKLVLMKQRGDFSEYPALLAAMVELAQPGLVADLEQHFDEQRRRLKRRVLGA
jgi:HK97 family phage portal protein